MDYYSALKRNEKTWWKLKCISLSKRRQSEKAMYCMISTVWHPGKGKLWRQWFPESKEKQITEDFFRTVKLFWLIVQCTMVDTCHCTFVRIHRMHNTKSRPWCELQTLGANNVLCGFINHNKCTAVVQDVNSRGGCSYVGMRLYGKSVCLLLNCAVNLRLLFKNLSLLNKKEDEWLAWWCSG